MTYGLKNYAVQHKIRHGISAAPKPLGEADLPEIVL
jgi:hypothetical protein